MMALRKEAQSRYPSVAALSLDLQSYLEGRPVRDFFRNRYFTPTLQTALVVALESLGSVEGLKRFIDIAPSQYHGLNFCQGSVAEMLENPGRETLQIIEVQNGSYLGEDDIVRFKDDYGRSTEVRSG